MDMWCVLWWPLLDLVLLLVKRDLKFLIGSLSKPTRSFSVVVAPLLVSAGLVSLPKSGPSVIGPKSVPSPVLPPPLFSDLYR